MEALTAYATYTQGREWRTTPARLSVVPPEHVPAAVELVGRKKRERDACWPRSRPTGGNRGGTHG
jgi:hypothetical protein